KSLATRKTPSPLEGEGWGGGCRGCRSSAFNYRRRELGRARGAQLLEIVAGEIGGARQRRGRDHEEAFAEGHGAIGRELVGRDEAVDGVVLRRRLQVLPDGEEVD